MVVDEVVINQLTKLEKPVADDDIVIPIHGIECEAFIRIGEGFAQPGECRPLFIINIST